MPTSVTQMLSASILLAAITVCVTQATVAMDTSVQVFLLDEDYCEYVSNSFHRC